MPRKNIRKDRKKQPAKASVPTVRPGLRALAAKSGGEAVLVDRPERKMLLASPFSMGFSGYTPLPHMLHAKLKYTSYVSLSGTVATGVNVYSANGLYDPDVSASGHQPRGFDQLIPLYDHYVVTSSTIHVEMLSSNANGTPGVGGINLVNSSTPQTDYIDYAEQARSEFGLLPNVVTYGCVQEPHRRSMKFNAKEFMGIPDPLTATKLQGGIGTNPADGAFFHVWSQAYDGSAAYSALALITIEYNAYFIEPVPVAPS